MRNYKREKMMQKKRNPKYLIEDAMRAKNRYNAKKTGRVKLHDGMELDHKTPLSRGGSNDPSNLRVVSRTTNRKKGSRLGR